MPTATACRWVAGWRETWPGWTPWSWTSSPRPAREAFERGDASDEALLTAVRGIAQAEDERGG